MRRILVDDVVLSTHISFLGHKRCLCNLEDNATLMRADILRLETILSAFMSVAGGPVRHGQHARCGRRSSSSSGRSEVVQPGGVLSTPLFVQ